jgi:hypothetical protein
MPRHDEKSRFADAARITAACSWSCETKPPVFSNRDLYDGKFEQLLHKRATKKGA